MRSCASTLDMYRKVPADLMEGTRRGSILSLLAVFSMATLFLMETKSFLTTDMVTQLSLDNDKEDRVMVTFNITMMDLRCDHVVVESASAMDTNQSIAQNIEKWSIDAEGVRKQYKGRNRDQRDIITRDESITRTLEDLHQDGEDAVSLDEDLFEMALEENEFLFVAFYKPGLSDWEEAAPAWETLAEIMNDVAMKFGQLAMKEYREEFPDEFEENYEYSEEDYEAAAKMEFPVTVAKVNCDDYSEFCGSQGVNLYPTFRLFVDGEGYSSKAYGKDYHGDRTVVAFSRYLADVELSVYDEKSGFHYAEQVARYKLNKTATEHQWRRERGAHRAWVDADHPGCQIAGHLLLDRVPGSFQIKAKSNYHEIDSRWTNASHVIHHLAFGEPDYLQLVEGGHAFIPTDIATKITPFDRNAYVTHRFHQAFHHHLKLVNINFNDNGGHGFFNVYQVLPQSQLSEYPLDKIPEAKFVYDFSPVAIHYKKSNRMWYDYLTSVMAIVGGTFSMLGMFESSIQAIVSNKKLLKMQ